MLSSLLFVTLQHNNDRTQSAHTTITTIIRRCRRQLSRSLTLNHYVNGHYDNYKLQQGYSSTSSTLQRNKYRGTTITIKKDNNNTHKNTTLNNKILSNNNSAIRIKTSRIAIMQHISNQILTSNHPLLLYVCHSMHRGFNIIQDAYSKTLNNCKNNNKKIDEKFLILILGTSFGGRSLSRHAPSSTTLNLYNNILRSGCTIHYNCRESTQRQISLAGDKSDIIIVMIIVTRVKTIYIIWVLLNHP